MRSRITMTDACVVPPSSRGAKTISPVTTHSQSGHSTSLRARSSTPGLDCARHRFSTRHLENVHTVLREQQLELRRQLLEAALAGFVSQLREGQEAIGRAQAPEL